MVSPKKIDYSLKGDIALVIFEIWQGKYEEQIWKRVDTIAVCLSNMRGMSVVGLCFSKVILQGNRRPYRRRLIRRGETASFRGYIDRIAQALGVDPTGSWTSAPHSLMSGPCFWSCK